MAYKAVNNNRTSCVVWGTKYSLKYCKGDIVKKHPGTLGIFCFKTKRYAEKFLACDTPILKVRGKNPQKPPPEIPDFTGNFISMFYKKSSFKVHMIPTPPGTILYDEVKVLE